MLALQHGEKCGCDLLEELNITQQTFSHHMKILADSGLVDYYKEGKWIHYSISADEIKDFREMIGSYARSDCETDESVSCGCYISVFIHNLFWYPVGVLWNVHRHFC